ncbi:MAG TPA: hypothetical protein DDW54_04770 [Clostridiales bacterium]|nr:hypothetical protein [Clostridiales bacterium]
MKHKKFKKEETAAGKLFSRVFRKIGDAFYSLTVAAYNILPKRKKPKNPKMSKVGEKVFYWAILVIPLIQFAIMYVAVNINSFLFAFQKYSYKEAAGTITETVEWVGFENFSKFITEIFGDPDMILRLKNSFIVYGVHLFIGTVFAILFAYYCYKGFRGTGFFRVTLMVPSIISSVILILIYKYVCELALPALFGIDPLLQGSDKKVFAVVVAYGVIMGFGSSVLMYSNAMSRIPDSLVEYARLEGCSAIREFFSITLPLSYPTIETFLIIGISAIFTDQANVFTFFDVGASTAVQTIGYYLYNVVYTTRGSMDRFPYAAAAGLTLTAVTIPVVMIARFFLDKLDKGVEF